MEALDQTAAAPIVSSSGALARDGGRREGRCRGSKSDSSVGGY